MANKDKKKPLENYTERKVVEWAREQGIASIKLNLMGNVGWPDRLFLIPGGKPLLMEFKRAGLRPTKLQQHRINGLKKLGYLVYVAEDTISAKAFIEVAYFTREEVCHSVQLVT